MLKSAEDFRSCATIGENVRRKSKNKRGLVHNTNPIGAFRAQSRNYWGFQSCDGPSSAGLQHFLVCLSLEVDEGPRIYTANSAR